MVLPTALAFPLEVNQEGPKFIQEDSRDTQEVPKVIQDEARYIKDLDKLMKEDSEAHKDKLTVFTNKARVRLF